MTTRLLCLWIPNWPVQRRQARQPALRDRPLVLFAVGRRGQKQVVTHCRRAAGLGVSIGMSLAEAKTLMTDRRGRAVPCFLPHEPAEDREALHRLAWFCDRFSPIVGLEESDEPESLLFDLTGCAPLFEGEERLARQLQQHVQQYGLHVRIAVADTIGAAWALAHGGVFSRDVPLLDRPREGVFPTRGLVSAGQAVPVRPSASSLPGRISGTTTRNVVIIAGDCTLNALRLLPVTALRLSSRTVAQLHEFQLRQIGQLLALPRHSLPSRFGAELLRRIDQACGTLDERIVATRPPEPIVARWDSEVPLQSTAALEVVMTGLLQDVLVRVQERGEGIARLTARLTMPGRREQTLSVDCVRPTTDLAHLLELLQLRWERESFSDGLTQVQLTVVQTGPLRVSEPSLWTSDDVGTNERDLERLLERLSSRLGADAVLRPVLTDDVQPERSFGYVVGVGGGGWAEGRERRAESRKRGAAELSLHDPLSALSRLIRPVWLLPVPLPIEVLAADAWGPPYWFRWQRGEYTLGRHWGPERITTGWWRHEYVRRDYYHVEATGGERFWLFRELRTGKWFLHARGD